MNYWVVAVDGSATQVRRLSRGGGGGMSWKVHILVAEAYGSGGLGCTEDVYSFHGLGI